VYENKQLDPSPAVTFGLKKGENERKFEVKKRADFKAQPVWFTLTPFSCQV
jgi:hypothetical protein